MRMSEQQVQDYYARQFSANRKGATATGMASAVSDEALLHNQIISECKRRGWIAFHGSMAHSTFRTEGEPDFVILADGGKVFLIECKTAKGKLSPAQLGIKAWAKRLGSEIHVCRSFADFLDVVNDSFVEP